MKRAMAGICLAAVLTAVACVSTGCYGTLYVSFDAGEYGTIVGDYTQAIPLINDLVYPEVEAEAGYVFVGFKQTPEKTPKSGKVKMTAQYQRAEFQLVDDKTGEYLEEGKRLMLPTWGQNACRRPSPKIEATVTDMQSEETATGVFEVNQFVETYSLLSVKFEFLPVENEYVTYSDNLLWAKDTNNHDWETTVEINVQCCGKKYHALKDFDTKRFDIGMGHIRVTEIELGLEGIWLDDKVYSDGIAKSGSTVLLQADFYFEDGEHYLLNLADDLIIKRIWSINGDEISPEKFNLYANYTVVEGIGWGVQLTDLVGNGWRVEVVAVDKRDEITSNVYTIEVF